MGGAAFRQLSQPAGELSRLITFDKRGTGLSDRDVEDPTLEARMDDIRAVMDAAGSKRAAMLGISEGGPMAAMFAATYPERTRALVLYGSFAEFSSWVPTPERLRAVEDYIDQAWGSGGILVSLAPHLAEDESFRAWWRRHERLAASPSAALALMRMNSQIDIRGILPSIRVPTLVVHRALDMFIDVEGGRHLAAHIPGAEYFELPGCDHAPWAGDTDGSIDRVEEFLTGARSAREPDRVLATVMFADMAASTRTALRLGDRYWRSLLGTYHATVKREIARHRGRAIKTIGDGSLQSSTVPRAPSGPGVVLIICHFWVTRAREVRRPVRAGFRRAMCPVREAAGLPLVTPAGAEAVPGPAG